MKIEKDLYEVYIKKYVKQGYSEKESQLKALEELKQNHDIDFWEVR